MLVSLRDVMAVAEQRGIAIAAFNTPSLEACRAAIEAAEETGIPVIIQHAECHENIVPIDVIGPTMVALSERSCAPVCVHLDHGENFFYIMRALEMGFTGIMYDGSSLNYEQNVQNSGCVADMCRRYDCGLECELGCLGAREGDVVDDGSSAEFSPVSYTDPDQAPDFVARTRADLLACSFGTVHGLYRGRPNLSFDVLAEVRKRVSIPLVMHGGSGVSSDDYRRAIDAGIRKINYYTYGVKAAGGAVCSLVDECRADLTDHLLLWHDMTIAAYESLRADFTRTVLAFAGRG